MSQVPPLHSASPPPVGKLGTPGWLVNLGIIALIAALWPLDRWMQVGINPYFYTILVAAGINVILATGLNLINGITGQFSLGHAGFMAIGAYTAGSLMEYFNPPDQLQPVMLAGLLVVAAFAAAIAGLAVGIPTLRLRGDYLAVATLGFGEIINIIIVNTDEIPIHDHRPIEIGGSSGLHGIPICTTFFWVAGAAILSVVCVWRLARSTRGKAFLAVREDEIAAAAMGIDTTFHKVAAFVIGAAWAGVAGGLWATWFGDLDPDSFRFTRSIEIVTMVVLGGSGSITGSILAAILLTFLPEWLRDAKDYTGGVDLRMILYSLLLIGMMLLRPEGLLGRRELWFPRKRPHILAKAPPT